MSQFEPTPVHVSLRSSLQVAVDQITRQLEQGNAIDIESYVARYPEHAGELRDLLPALQALVELGLTDSGSDSLGLSDKESRSPTDGILGDFRIVRELGRGGMGIVYEAEQISLKRRVALKVLPFGALLDKRQLERFHNEAKAAARLKHPNLVSVYSVGCERAVHFYAMELVEGKSLAQLIEELKSPTEKKSRANISAADTQAIAELSTEYSDSPQRYFRSVARLAIQAAEALEYAHREGVIHRDIKPSNLLLDDTGKLWVADFGLAQIQTEHTLTVTGDLVGTLRYMSPEQAAGKKLLDQRTDIYSLGITLYELVTLVPAFAADEHQLLLQQVTEQQPRRPRQLNSTIPTDLETIILKATAKEAESRYQSARELAEDLNRFLEQRPIKARRASRAEHLWRWAKRNPTMAGLSATLFSVLLFLAIAGPLVAIRQTSLATARAKSEQELRLSQERLRQELYQSELNSAYSAWHRYHLATSRQLLERHRPKPREMDLREFAWYYLWGLHQKIDNQPTLENRAGVQQVEFSPDGHTLAAGCRDGVVRLWDVTRRTMVRELDGHSRVVPSMPSAPSKAMPGVTSIAFSPDGQHLVSCGYDGRLLLWRVSDGKSLETLLQYPTALRDLNFSPDGTLLAVAGYEGTVGIFEMSTRNWTRLPVVTGDVVLKSPQEIPGELAQSSFARLGVVHSVEFSPDAKLLAAGSEDRMIRIWEVATGTLRHAWPSSLTAHTVVFLPDGETIAHDASNSQVIFLNIVTGQSKAAFRVPLASEFSALAISPSGKVLATVCSDRTLRLWDLNTSELLDTLVGHAAVTTCVAFSPGGKMLATGSTDGTVRLWDEFAQVPPGTKSEWVEWETEVAISPDQRTLATGWGPFGMRSGRGNIKLWDLQMRPPRMIAEIAEELAPVHSLAFSPVAPILASGGGRRRVTGEVKLWDSKTGSLLKTLPGHSCTVDSVAFSPDGRMLATAGEVGDKTVKLWDVATGQPQHEFKPLSLDDGLPYQSRVTFSPDGTILAAAGSRWLANRADVRLWDAKSGVELDAFLVDGGEVNGLTFSPDGKRLAIASVRGVVTLWDIRRQRTHRSFTSGFSATALAISPDGKTLAVGARENDVQLWHADTGGQLGTLPIPHWVANLSFTPDGRTLIAGCDNKTVWMWTIPRADVPGDVSSVVVLDTDNNEHEQGTANTEKSLNADR